MTENKNSNGGKPETKYEGFIASDDIGYGPDGGLSATVKIESYAQPGTVKDATGKVVEQPIVYFRGASKGLILNRTNSRILKLIHGKKQSEWVGKPVTLKVAFINAFGERDIPTIRIEPPKGVPLPFGMRKWMGKEKPTNTK